MSERLNREFRAVTARAACREYNRQNHAGETRDEARELRRALEAGLDHALPDKLVVFPSDPVGRTLSEERLQREKDRADGWNACLEAIRQKVFAVS